MKYLFVFLFCALALTSCKNEVPGAPYIIPVILIAAAGYFGIVAYKKSKSPSEQQTPGGYKTYKEPVKFWKIGQFWFAVILLLASFGSYKWMKSEYRFYDPKKDAPMPVKPAPDGRESAEDQAQKADSLYNLK